MTFREFDQMFIGKMHQHGIPVLRFSLGIVFLWFGALKLAGASPVVDLIGTTYSFIPTYWFIVILGIWEVLVGVGLLAKRFLRLTLFFLWLQMAGTLFSAVLAPQLFFAHGNFFALTMEGEFLVKNFVLIAAGIVIGGHEVEPKE